MMWVKLDFAVAYSSGHKKWRLASRNQIQLEETNEMKLMQKPQILSFEYIWWILYGISKEIIYYFPFALYQLKGMVFVVVLFLNVQNQPFLIFVKQTNT